MQGIYVVEFRSYYESMPNIRFSTAAENAENKYSSENWRYYEIKENAQLLRSLLVSVEADCNEGSMSQLWELHNSESVGSITIRYFGDGYKAEYLDIIIYNDCKNTIAFLKGLAK